MGSKVDQMDETSNPDFYANIKMKKQLFGIVEEIY